MTKMLEIHKISTAVKDDMLEFDSVFGSACLSSESIPGFWHLGAFFSLLILALESILEEFSKMR